jgi:hypothetical protein
VPPPDDLSEVMDTKKYLLIFLATACSLSLLLTVFSYFSDTEASIENGFTAGVWAVSVSGSSSGDTASRVYTGLSANQTGTDSWTVTNTGTIPAYVDFVIAVSAGGTGELEDHMFTSLYFSGGSTVCANKLVKNIARSYNQNLLLKPGESNDLVLDWHTDGIYYPDENDIVTVAITFDIKPAP